METPKNMLSGTDMSLFATTPQGFLLEPEDFQCTLIRNMASTLLRSNHPPCLLRAPTGSGKTFMLARVLAEVSAEKDVLWFWFVPFVNLVAQTLDALVTNSSDLSPELLTVGRNQEASAGQVLISTVQSVARATWRAKGYNADSDDETRTIAEFVARARIAGLRIGMVVDEAHIALDKATEFGKFASWLSPDFLLLATATPKDQRILDFLGSAGKSDFESFTVSRDDVVKARLNKKYIEAVVYDLRQSMQSVTDLKQTVLRQAWRRNQKLKRELAASGIQVNPLLLVQVANGEKAVEEAEQDLIRLCKVPPHAIGKHSAAAPDPVMMAAIANDSSKEVLIFKQSAGTGFDAPRAFVLASTKTVNDNDFAMQFIGRVMRVSRAIRDRYRRPDVIPENFDTAYVYLANAEAQRGFEAALHATSQVQSQLEGETEKMALRKTLSGATVITNKTTNQTPLSYGFSIPEHETLPSRETPPAKPHTLDEPQNHLFDDTELGELDELVPDSASIGRKINDSAPTTVPELVKGLQERGLRTYSRRQDMPNLPHALKCESRPIMVKMTQISRTIAARLEIPAKHIDDAIKVAQNKLREIERHTELTTRHQHDETVLVVTDRNALSREAITALRALPQVEDEDVRVILEVLAQRLHPAVQHALDDMDEESVVDEKETQRMSRDAANWIVKLHADRLAEAMHAAIAEQADTIDAGPLPDAMLFPQCLPLAISRKNVYGVFPPSRDELSQVEHVMLLNDRLLLRDKIWGLGNSCYLTGQYDGSASLNGEELAFAQALDRSQFVTWWHRNPDRKPYSVRLVRGEHKNFFYPDFIVSLEHYPGDQPIMRLIETKQDVKDAARKAKHVPSFYGKVLFLTKDSHRLRWVKDDGGLGSDVDLDDLVEVREWLRNSRPAQADVH